MVKAACMLFLLAGAAMLTGENDWTYMLLGSSPFVLAVAAALSWILVNWLRAPKRQCGSSALGASAHNGETGKTDSPGGSETGVTRSESLLSGRRTSIRSEFER